MPRVRRRWLALGLVVVLVLVSLRLLYQPVTLRSYRELDPQTLVVAGIGAPGAWTHLDGVQETQSTVTISVSAFTLELGPHTDAGNLLEVQVHLTAPLGGREVVDGSTGQPLARDVSLIGWSR
jgi:hypothetical protein